MLVSTTPQIEGRNITEYLGIVSGEAVMGANIVKDIFATVRDIVGGRAGAYEKELKKAKETALNDMIEEAKKLGANAIVGVEIDYHTIGGMMMVCASGTAVVLR